MSESKHTPGPWVSSKFGFQVLTGDSWNTICELRGPAEWEDKRGSYEQEFEGQIQQANARLIASAPDLLEALDNLLHAYSEPDRRLCCEGRDCGCMGATVHQEAEHYARKAIARAEGRSDA